jgi:hypothetical protein
MLIVLALFDAFSTFVIVCPNAYVDAIRVTRENLTLDFRALDVQVRQFCFVRQC